MSGLPEQIPGVDVREQGNALRVATNTPHLVSLGTGRLSTAVTLHPIKQGRVTIGSDPTCDIYVLGGGVASVHCRVENSHGVVTLYPVSGSTLLDGLPVDKATRLSQGCMLTIGRSNYLRFNHPEEAKLMKSVLPGGHISMGPIQIVGNDSGTGFPSDSNNSYHTPQKYDKNNKNLQDLDNELNSTIKEIKKKPPSIPKKQFHDNLSESDNETQKPKLSSIMAKVSKFEYYAKQQKNNKSQFYTNEIEISPKVFSSHSLTVNTPAKDVLVNKNAPSHYSNKNQNRGNNQIVAIDKNDKFSYANVTIRNKTKIDDLVKNFDDGVLKKVNNDEKGNVYGKINKCEDSIREEARSREDANVNKAETYGKIVPKPCLPSACFDREPQYSPAYSQQDRNTEMETKRLQAHQNRRKEEDVKEAENARLEEILNMCAEYERQVSSGTPTTPVERRSHNKIITNGSLPRSVAMNNPNFVMTNEGYYKFDTSNNSPTNVMSRSLPVHSYRNVSSYENIDVAQLNLSGGSDTPQLNIKDGSVDEIGIPVFEELKIKDISSPILIRKLQNGELTPTTSPYENMLYNKGSLKPKSPNTNSPRSRIKTTFAHKNLPSPQYFIFPTPPPKSNLNPPNFITNKPENQTKPTVPEKPKMKPTVPQKPKTGIEKQLSLEEDIPMIDDTDLHDDIEFRSSKIEHHNELDKTADVTNKKHDNSHDHGKVTNDNGKLKNYNSVKVANEVNGASKNEYADKNENLEAKNYKTVNTNDTIVVKNEFSLKEEVINQSFDEVRKELMADIPELDEFEKDLKQNREKVIRNAKTELNMDIEIDTLPKNEDLDKMRARYEVLKEERRQLLTEIHEHKAKMSEIRAQEDDILRELEMEKALIKGEYDSEIAILNIEQKKRLELIERCKRIEGDIRRLKDNQEKRQEELKVRVDIASLKVERIEKDMKSNSATLDDLMNARDALDNETKLFEDLEFQHLEEESELLSNREDLQNEIIILSKKIDNQKSRILTLKSEANNNLTCALDETKILQAEYVRLLNKVEVITTKVQAIEKELKPIVIKLNDHERTQSPDSAFFTDQNRAKSGEFGYSPQSSDSETIDKHFVDHENSMKEKFNAIDQMSQSMIVDIERRDIDEIIGEKKKGFWERNFDSLSRKRGKKNAKNQEKIDIMSQSLNENLMFDNDIENSLDRTNSLRQSNSKKKSGPIKSNSSSLIPTFAALGKIIKKDSFKKTKKADNTKNNRYVKNTKITDNTKYSNAKSKDESNKKIAHRKSYGDEPNSNFELKKTNDLKVASQDDIDRISKVTLDAPLLPSDKDLNSLDKKTLDSLMEIEKKRMEMLEEQGCQVIENEREKILELKKRVQDETKKLWDQRNKQAEQTRQSGEFDSYLSNLSSGFDGSRFDRAATGEDTSLGDDLNVTNSTVFEESSGMISASSIEELQVRNSRTESTTEDEKRSDDSRPLSNASDFSRENILYSSVPRRSRRGLLPLSESQRPLTRYLPSDREDFDLRRHVESAGHQADLCPHLTVTSTSCRGYLHKLGAKFHTWSKRWFVFDRDAKTFVYYWDKTEKKPRGGAYFQVIEEVYLDHGNTSKSPSPQTTFIVKTRQRRYYLMAPSGEAARIWIDVIFTGAQGYLEYIE